MWPRCGQRVACVVQRVGKAKEPCLLLIPLSRFVYVAAVADSEDEDDQVVVVDFIDEAIVACSYPPFAVAPDELDRFGRSWIRS